MRQKLKTILISAVNGIIDGFLNAFTISFDPVRKDRSPADDARNIRSDWERVGMDLKKAMFRFDHELKSSNNQLYLFDNDTVKKSDNEQRPHQPV